MILSYVSFGEDEKTLMRNIDVIKIMVFIMSEYGDKIDGIVEEVL